MKAQVFRILLTLGLFLAVGCVGEVAGSLGDGDDDGVTPPDDDNPPPPPPPPPLPEPAVYKRGSLTPIYELTPRAEYGRFLHNGVTMADADFAAVGNGFVSAAQKLDEIAFQIAQERGVPSVNIITRAEDRQRAQTIPFRGNPSDVDFIELDGVTRIVVPLGGDLMTPGNEIAITALNGVANTIRVKVGIRPQRVAVHESGIAFVCNQFSNYISVIDLRTGQHLRNANGVVEIPTEYYCTDLLLVERNPIAQDEDEVDLYVSNGWRASVLRYGLEVLRDPLNDRAIDVRIVDPVNPEQPNQAAQEITGVGHNPYRLELSESQDAIFVANNRGGEVARISTAQKAATARIAIGGAAVDVLNIADQVYVPTTTIDRGLLARDEPVQPLQVLADPVILTGADGQPHEAHPGAIFDRTRSYNFEDLRNGMLAIPFTLTGQNSTYFTDDVSAEANFADQQKILEGAIPQDLIRNAAGTRIFAAMSASDTVQELEVAAGAFRLRDGNRTFQTAERPFALALNEDEDELYVVSWGGEVLEIFDAGSTQRLQTIDLGYAVPAYPATNIERGEYFFQNAEWSNNGRKSCATCHLDELLADGYGFSNGVTTPTAYHNVPPNFNLLTTDSYFWNGSFSNGTYTSLALAAQTRTNCELVLFGLIEGPAQDPATRVGDPNNRVTNGQDNQCRPIVGQAGLLPENFAQIAPIIAAQKLVAAQVIEQETGFTRDEVFRFVDFYDVAEMRLPPNPLNYLYKNNELDSATMQKVQRGEQLFSDTGCVNCHDPFNTRAPFSDGLNHGAGSEWAAQFVNTYFADPRLTETIGGIPQPMLEGISASVNDSEINIHLDPVDYFVPFCFDVTSCLSFDDPLVVRGLQAEDDRLDSLIAVNLGDPDRGFVPGNPRGQPTINTRSLRGVWWMANLLHHGYANSIAEAILGPGHAGLRDGEKGFAVNALGEVDVHGVTSGLSPADVEALVLYVSSIE